MAVHNDAGQCRLQRIPQHLSSRRRAGSYAHLTGNRTSAGAPPQEQRIIVVTLHLDRVGVQSSVTPTAAES
ncbi:Uncharacterized protein PBTT_00236 [Plasmodiophora brassicae]